jgi:acetylornithine deacetylase/succinyl-diaminopimelate desuccinylase-like protein
MTTPTINAPRLLRELHHLATLTDCPPSPDPQTTAVTRIVFTPRDLEARAYIISVAETAGFLIHTDAIGNTFFRWAGTEPTLPAVATGSHADAIPHAGMYDGTVGVLAGLEAMRSLKESAFQPRRSIETILLTSEEPTRFGIGCLGSRLLGGILSPTTADALPDLLPETNLGGPSSPIASSSDKVGPQDAPATLHQVRNAAGFTGDLTTVPLPKGHFYAWLELHIEQGPLLERAMQNAAVEQTPVQQTPVEQTPVEQTPVEQTPVEQTASEQTALLGTGFSPSDSTAPTKRALAPEGMPTILGIVTHIAAPASYRYTIEGIGGHAGALLMPDRRDALCAAAELILSIERHTLAANAASHTSNSVATIGTVAVHPGAVNSVPSRVTLMLDIRDTDPSRRDQTMAALHTDIAELEQRRRVTITEQKINADTPTTSDPHILATLKKILTEQKIPFQEMVSRAYHDTSFISRIAPVAMLFIPCRNGVSHRPDEFATPESIALGTQILAQTLAHLASE